MSFDPQKHHRRSIRLKGYDYAQPGAYFVTICTHQRLSWFGDIREGRMCLNHIGSIVAQEWVRSSQMRQEIELDEWIIMPNHIHGIVIITYTNNIDINNGGAQDLAPLHKSASNPTSLHRQPRSLSSFIGGFKSAITKCINTLRKAPGIPIWQRNYHEKIIEDEATLHTIRNYIINNPQRWVDDPENTQHEPEKKQIFIDLPF